MADNNPEENGAATQGAEVTKATMPTVDWDDSSMRTSYANVVNATSTQEEVTLFFGTNLTWKSTEDKSFKVRLDDRIVLNPRAAKRLWVLLGVVIGEHEKRFGSLGMERAKPGVSTATSSKGNDKG